MAKILFLGNLGVVEIVLIVTGGRDRKEKKIKNKVKEGNALFFCL